MARSNLDPERHLETVAQCTRDGILTVGGDATVQYANPAIEDIFGYAAAEIVGQPLSVLLTEDRARDVEEWFDQSLQESTPSLKCDDVRLQGLHRDGSEIPLRVSFGDFEQGGKTYVSGVVRDITERQRREERLTTLNRLAQDLTGAESATEVCQRTITAAGSVLAHPIAAVELYDADEGRLETSAVTAKGEEIADGNRLFEAERSIPWEVFASQEGRVVNDLLAETTIEGTETPLRSAVFQPIGTHGVFIAGSCDENAFREADANAVNTLVGNAYSALERVTKEEALRERNDRLQEKTETLDRVRRINDVIRDLTNALTQATDRAEITAEVCTRLAASDPYRFAWFGSRDPANDEVVPEAAAGVENGYLEEIEIEVTDEESAAGLIERAIRTRTPQVRNDIYRDPPFEPWRRAAIERDYRASIAVPVVYQDTLYGILNLYASEAGVFEQMEVAVLQELGETIGYALNAEERKQAFTSERSVELAFEVDGYENTLLDLGEQTDGRFELENLVERRDESATMFFTAHNQEPDDVMEWAAGQSQIRDLRLLTDRDEECLFECSLDGSTVWAQLLQRGSVVREAIATPESGKIVVRIPQSADPRSFDSLLEEHFANAELVARREYEEPVMTPEEFEDEFRDRLTERQDEVLQTAYYAGYFEWPRRVKSGELADILGVAQPTVSRHLRSGEQKFLSMVYDDL